MWLNDWNNAKKHPSNGLHVCLHAWHALDPDMGLCWGVKGAAGGGGGLKAGIYLDFVYVKGVFCVSSEKIPRK